MGNRLSQWPAGLVIHVVFVCAMKVVRLHCRQLIITTWKWVRMDGARREWREEGCSLESRVQICIGWIDPRLLSRDRTVWPDTLHSQVLSLSTLVSRDRVWWLTHVFVLRLLLCEKKEEPLWRPVHLELHFLSPFSGRTVGDCFTWVLPFFTLVRFTGSLSSKEDPGTYVKPILKYFLFLNLCKQTASIVIFTVTTYAVFVIHSHILVLLFDLHMNDMTQNPVWQVSGCSHIWKAGHTLLQVKVFLRRRTEACQVQSSHVKNVS